MKIAAQLFFVATLVVLAGCQNQRSATFSTRGPATAIAVTGDYRHELSGMAFPTQVAEFERKRLLQYDRAGRSVSAVYAIDGATTNITATVFVFPARAARADRCRGQLESASADLVRVHPGARRDAVDDATLVQAGRSHAGAHATFVYDEPIRNERWPSTAQIYLFCNVAEEWQFS